MRFRRTEAASASSRIAARPMLATLGIVLATACCLVLTMEGRAGRGVPSPHRVTVGAQRVAAAAAGAPPMPAAFLDIASVLQANYPQRAFVHTDYAPLLPQGLLERVRCRPRRLLSVPVGSNAPCIGRLPLAELLPAP